MFLNVFLSNVKLSFEELNIFVDGEENVFFLDFELLVYFPESLVDVL